MDPPVAQRPGAAGADHAVLGRQRHRRPGRRPGAAAGAVHPAALDRGAGDRGAARLAAPAGGPAEGCGRGGGRPRCSRCSGVCAYNILVYRGLHATTAVNALLLQSVMPLAVLLANLAAVPRAAPADAGRGHRGVASLGVLVIAAPRVAGHAAASAGQPRRRAGAAGGGGLRDLLRHCCGGGRRCIRSASWLATFAHRRRACWRRWQRPSMRCRGAAGAGVGWRLGAVAYAVVFASFLATLVLQPWGGAGGCGAGRAVQPPAAGVRDLAGSGGCWGRGCAPTTGWASRSSRPGWRWRGGVPDGLRGGAPTSQRRFPCWAGRASGSVST